MTTFRRRAAAVLTASALSFGTLAGVGLVAAPAALATAVGTADDAYCVDSGTVSFTVTGLKPNTGYTFGVTYGGGDAAGFGFGEGLTTDAEGTYKATFDIAYDLSAAPVPYPLTFNLYEVDGNDDSPSAAQVVVELGAAGECPAEEPAPVEEPAPEEPVEEPTPEEPVEEPAPVEEAPAEEPVEEAPTEDDAAVEATPAIATDKPSYTLAETVDGVNWAATGLLPNVAFTLELFTPGEGWVTIPAAEGVTQVADAEGVATGRVVMTLNGAPADFGVEGEYQLRVTQVEGDQTVTALTTFTVGEVTTPPTEVPASNNAPAPAAPAPSKAPTADNSNKLAETGLDDSTAMIALGAGLVLVAAGAGLMVVRRRFEA